jgi:hypothetical protein
VKDTGPSKKAQFMVAVSITPVATRSQESANCESRKGRRAKPKVLSDAERRKMVRHIIETGQQSEFEFVAAQPPQPRPQPPPKKRRR